MVWVHVVVWLAVVEFVVFAALVARARGRYGVKAPATTGHETFERYYRVQMNTLELLVIFIPALLLSAHYWVAAWSAALGALFLIGRLIYLRAYVRDPPSRSLGYGLSVFPIIVLLVAAGVGLVRTLWILSAS